LQLVELWAAGDNLQPAPTCCTLLCPMSSCRPKNFMERIMVIIVDEKCKVCVPQVFLQLHITGF
jgi:hypothetical protein